MIFSDDEIKSASRDFSCFDARGGGTLILKLSYEGLVLAHSVYDSVVKDLVLTILLFRLMKRNHLMFCD